MTKERLEELIKQEEWVWLIDDEQKCFGLKLDNRLHIKDNSLRSELETVYATLNNIFETKKQAEWALKTVTERTERFEPPIWEEIGKEYEFNFLYIQVVRPGLYFVRHIRFAVYLYDNLNQICIYDVDDVDFEKKFKGKGTKENYEKACDIVRELFLRGGVK